MKPDIKALYDEVYETAVIRRAREYVKEGAVSGLCSDTEAERLIIRAEVTGSRVYAVRIEFEKSGELYDYECDCPAFVQYAGPCKHLCAAAMVYERERAVASDLALPGSGFSAKGLIEVYRERAVKELTVHEGADVILSACIALINGRGQVTFEVGKSRFYVLRDLVAFAQRISTGASFRYGERLEFVHDIENFRPDYRALTSFVVEQSKTEALYRAGVGGKLGALLLDGRNIDRFFNLYPDDGITFQDSPILQERLRLAIVRQNPTFPLVLERDQAGYTLHAGDYRFFSGEKKLYLIVNQCLYICDEGFYRAMTPLVGALSQCKSLQISTEEIRVFYKEVLMPTLPFIKALGDGWQSAAADPIEKGRAVLYLDLGDKGEITAEAAVFYGEQRVLPLSAGAEQRDYPLELCFRKLVDEYFETQAEGLRLVGEECIYRFLTEGRQRFLRLAELFATDRFKNLQVRRPVRMQLGVRLKSDLVNMQISFDGYTQEQLAEILAAYRKKKRYTRLKDGSFAEIDRDALGKVEGLLDTLNLGLDSLKGDITLPKYRAYMLSSLESELSLQTDETFREAIRRLEEGTPIDAELPKELDGILRNYQKAGFRWMRTLCECGLGGILADDMGLGKSVQLIALMRSYREVGLPSLIVCPTSLILNWQNEFNKFAPDTVVACVMGGIEERRLKVAASKEYDVLITSYDILRRDIDFYKGQQFLFAVVDEAQCIKNHTAKKSFSVKQIESRYRFALTGTPIENNLSELWSIFDFVMPGFLYGYSKFKDIFERPIITEADRQSAERLSRTVRPFILRRLKSNVLKELPPKVETVLRAGLDEQQKELYLAQLAEFSNRVKEAVGQNNKILMLSLLTKLRQICCSPQLVVEDYEGNDAKLEMLMELVQQAVASGHRLLVFSQFTSMLALIEKELQKIGVNFYTLQGSTPKEERMFMVNSFNAGEVSVFLISLRAGGTGLNLVGADMVVHYDPWWNLSVQNQATDRAYRMGQKNSVQVYKLILQDTIEEKILALQSRKQALSDQVIQEGEQLLSSLSHEDLMWLFNLREE